MAAANTMQAAAQLAAPPWVRARALGIYQLAFNGALAFGSMLRGWLRTALGLRATMAGAAAIAAALAFAVHGYGLDHSDTAAAQAPAPEDPAPELASMLPQSHGRILETMCYRVAPADRAEFLDAMQHVQHARGRAGALDWRLYEDVAHLDGWLEAWMVESWTDHLHEAHRLSDWDRLVLARISAFHDAAAPRPCRYIAVEPGPRASPPRNAASLATHAGPAR